MRHTPRFTEVRSVRSVRLKSTRLTGLATMAFFFALLAFLEAKCAIPEDCGSTSVWAPGESHATEGAPGSLKSRHPR